MKKEIARLIKFRAKRKWNGEWVFGNYIQVGDDWCYIVPTNTEYDDFNPCRIRVISSTVGEWTGHTLKGIDLYEGDIVRQEIPSDQGSDENNYYVVTWIKEWCMFGLLHIGFEYHQYLASGIEALDESSFWTYPLGGDEDDTKYNFLTGNIYDHPHLLLINEINGK